MRREFRPKPVEPPFASVAASGDGTWTAVPNPWASETEPLAWKTVLHPDPKLKIATATIVAMDLTRLRLAMVAGKGEPRSTNAAIKRPAVVPQEHMDKLFAAFNGGFMTVHGQYGMKVNGELLLPAKDGSCTVAIGKDGDIRIATWTKLPGRDAFPHFRQTPPCLVEAGEINPVVDAPNRLQWGLAVEGTAVIRRSAIGIDAAGTTLYYAFGEAVSPRAIAAAMKALGVRDAAQLDVNYSFPRFLFYAHPEGKPPVVRAPLATPVQFRPTEYVSGTQMRDFLYVYRAR